MKKLLVICFLIPSLVAAVSAVAADFTADADITVSAVAFGGTTADMLIMNGSTAESWNFSNGVFTVTNPGTFKVRSNDASVISFLVKNASNVTVACALNNATPGAGYYVTLPTASGTYTVAPSTVVSCSSLCSAQTGVAAFYYSAGGTYYTPSCGALTCSANYSLSASAPSTSTSCNPPAVSGSVGIVPGTGSTPAPTMPAPTPTPASMPTPPQASPAAQAAAVGAVEQWQNVLADAAAISGGNIDTIAASVGKIRSAAVESAAESKYTANLAGNLTIAPTAAAKAAIINFVAYGTPTTEKLGAGERAGVVNSFKAAFGKLPATETEWKDVIAIANGRWPGQKNSATEANAIKAFKKIYLREPNRAYSKDDAAVTVIAYGLRPANRNTGSEKAAIKSFKAIYGHAPVSASAWDIVRAIAYSGAKR